MGGDVFSADSADSASFGNFDAAIRKKQMGRFICHPSRGRRTQEESHPKGFVSGFLQKFPAGAVFERFIGELRFVADEPGADFQDTGLHGATILFDENDLVFGGDGEDSDNTGGIRAGGEFPAIDFPE